MRAREGWSARRLWAAGLVVAFSSGAVAETLETPSGSYPTIQSAIDAAVAGDEVVVAPGVYHERIDLLGKAITVRSSGGAGETTLDGGGAGSVVRFASGETRATLLRGFTLVNGSAVNGGGILVDGASPSIDACVVTGCSSTGPALDEGGGGIALLNGGAALISRTVFFDNFANSLGGGAMVIYDAAPTFVGCVFGANSADFGGGVANEIGAAPVYLNVTMTGNSAAIAPGVCNFQAGAEIRNSIIWGHTPDILNLTGGSATVTYSCVGQSYPGAGNFNADPVFEPETGPVRVYPLGAGSPAIDRGENARVPMDELDLDGDGDRLEAWSLDLSGRARFIDDPDSFDIGPGTAPIVDLGASEFDPGPAGCNGADLSEPYGALDFSDVVAFLGAFAGMEAIADLAAPIGSFDFSDVVAFLGAFGAGCP